MGLPESRRRAVESTWKPADEVTESGGESPGEEERGSNAVCDGKFLIRTLQKHGVVEGWTPVPAGFVAWGSFRDNDSTISRTKGQGSIVYVSLQLLFFGVEWGLAELGFEFVRIL